LGLYEVMHNYIYAPYEHVDDTVYVACAPWERELMTLLYCYVCMYHISFNHGTIVI
jgi:hypothetical protein